MSVIKDREPVDGMFTETELCDLEMSAKIRRDIAVKMTEKGAPTDNRDIRVLNEVLNSLDTQRMGIANARLKKEDTKNKEGIADQVVAALLEISRSKKATAISNPTITVQIPENYIPGDIVPGETTIYSEQLEIKDFVQGES